MDQKAAAPRSVRRELFRKEAVEASLGTDVRGGILQATSPRLMALWLAVMGMMVAAAVASFVVRVDQQSSGNGALVPMPGDAVLRAPIAARAEAVNVALGDEVHRGDVLTVLSDESLAPARRFEVRAPVDGVVARLDATEGSWLDHGDVLAAVRPAGARLVGRLELPARDLPQLAVGSEVRLKFDAWPSQEAGTGLGRITQIGEPLGDRGEARDTAAVLVEIVSWPDGASAPAPGMRFVGDVKVGQTRLIDVLFGGA